MLARVREWISDRRWRRKIALEQRTGVVITTGLPDGYVPPSVSLDPPPIDTTPHSDRG